MKKILFLGMFFVCLQAQAGLLINKTRLIFPGGDTTREITVMNVNHYPSFLQMWIDNGDVNNFKQDPEAPFIIIPPIFTLQPGEIKSLRVIYDGRKLPTDRESLYWINAYEVPAIRKNYTPEESLLMSMKMQIKLIYRPESLMQGAEKARQSVSCHINADNRSLLSCSNNSGYYISYSKVSLLINNKCFIAKSKLDLMLSPFSRQTFDLYPAAGSCPPGKNNIILKSIDDEGQTDVIQHDIS
ncbi:molecular chaperone [Tatumella punctata]|uniref:Molecular chaperone n=1 Tax=Tatumella punctata TaxID=399969 RepID=A0ABW1VR06_9GAMM